MRKGMSSPYKKGSSESACTEIRRLVKVIYETITAVPKRGSRISKRYGSEGLKGCALVVKKKSMLVINQHKRKEKKS